MLRGEPDISSLSGLAKDLLRMFMGRIKLWENARLVMVDVPLDRERAKAILPRAVWLIEPARATLIVANYTKTSFTVAYQEAAILIPVGTLYGRGVHCPWMVVNDDTALIYGREFLGYPKKLAEITFDENESGVKASVARRGIRVMSIEAERGAIEANPEPVASMKVFNVGGLGQSGPLNPVWMFKPREVIHEAYTAQASVELVASQWDPIAHLVSGPAVSARIAVVDIIGSTYLVPVGFAGLQWFTKTADMRYR